MFWDLKKRLLQRGRASLLFEPRDLWMGWFHGEDSDYIVLVPMLPVRIERRSRDHETADPRI